MMTRRELMALGVSSVLLSATANATAAPGSYRLRTRLFNLKDDLDQATATELIATLKAAASGVEGFLVGRNFVPDPFPTRFEWITMVQIDPATGTAGLMALDRCQKALDVLASHCRNEVECDLECPLPPGYANAAGVGVRHTVLFDFNPDATAEDRTRNVEAIRDMGKLPMVRNYLVQPGRAMAADPNQMQWQVVGDFASIADYRAYSAAPVHLAIREDFKAHTARVAFLDVAL
jgi:hypothetical protein